MLTSIFVYGKKFWFNKQNKDRRVTESTHVLKLVVIALDSNLQLCLCVALHCTSLKLPSFLTKPIRIGHLRILGIGLERACNRGSCGGMSLKRDYFVCILQDSLH